MINFVWQRRISPFDCCRVLGEPFMKEIIKNYLAKRIKDEYDQVIVGAYTYQIFMKENGTSEFALLINFNQSV